MVMEIYIPNNVNDFNNKIKELNQKATEMRFDYLDPTLDQWVTVGREMAEDAMKYYTVRICNVNRPKIETFQESIERRLRAIEEKLNISQ